ncbi:MAG: hypothetical protein H6611_06835 [Ignavibacteriales bacterium]|nr:hypothetical protein [Ignavibacteriales bacterium]
MVIATFTSGEYTQIGISGFRVKKTKTIDSKILFHDPEKFKDLFLELVEYLGFKLNENTNTKLIFAISGTIDEKNKEIIESKVLNDIAFSKVFNGFNFVKTFGELIKAKNIHLISTTNCVAFGQMHAYKRKLNFPVLSIFIDKEVGISIIKKIGIINYDSAIRPIKHLNNKDANNLICGKGIDDLLTTNTINFAENYTLILSEILTSIFNQLRHDGIICKNVFVHTSKYELIKIPLLRKNFSQMHFIITNAKDKERDLQINGALKYCLPKVNLKYIKFLVLLFFSIGLGTFITNGLIPNLKSTTVLSNISDIMPDFMPSLSLLGLVVGTVIYFFVHSLTNKIQKLGFNSYFHATEFDLIHNIKYYSSSGADLETFNNFLSFVEHWEKTKPIAFKENYYSIHYTGNVFIRVYLDDLKSISDLQKYKF